MTNQQPSQTANATKQKSAPLTTQDVKNINIKTEQGKAQVDQKLNNSLKSLDNSLQALDNSMGKIQ